jgi:hypothetical protein
MSAPTKAVEFYTPERAAGHLGISVPTLIALLKSGGYSYTELKPDAKPWGRGRQTWGLTAVQLQAVMDGQARRFAAADGGVGQGKTPPRKAVPTLPGHDGRSRLRRGKARD